MYVYHMFSNSLNAEILMQEGNVTMLSIAKQQNSLRGTIINFHVYDPVLMWPLKSSAHKS